MVGFVGEITVQGGKSIMIVIAAMINTVEGKGDEFEQEFRKLAPKVLNDPGVMAYALHRSVNDPTKFFVYEKYESQEALQQHGATPHFQEFSRAIASMLSGRPEIGLYNEVT